MISWLDENLEKEVKKVFEPRYKRKLSDDEVKKIAQNLTIFMEDVFRFRCKSHGK